MDDPPDEPDAAPPAQRDLSAGGAGGAGVTPATAADAAQRLRRAQSLVGTSEGRPEHDFYPTPVNAVEALLRVEPFSGPIWECACGDGAICKVLAAHGHTVRATDLIDRGYGEAPHDFLTSTETAANIITNPPFTLAEAFVHLALARTTAKTALLCKIQFLEGSRRQAMFQSTPLKAVWVFSKRLTLRRNGVVSGGSGMLCFAWFVWEHGHRGPAQLGWL